MLTGPQMDRAVLAVTEALKAYCSADVAEERARNLVTALMFPMHPIERRMAVRRVLDVWTGGEIRDYWAAVSAADLAFCKAIKEVGDE
jgi:hypothetical protein